MYTHQTMGRWQASTACEWKNSWHEAAARVPLIVQTPSQRNGDSPGVRLDTPVSLADVFPTLCGLADIKAPEGLEGRDLSSGSCDGGSIA